MRDRSLQPVAVLGMDEPVPARESVVEEPGGGLGQGHVALGVVRAQGGTDQAHHRAGARRMDETVLADVDRDMVDLAAAAEAEEVVIAVGRFGGAAEGGQHGLGGHGFGDGLDLGGSG